MVIQKYNLNETPIKENKSVKSDKLPKKRNLKWLLYLWLVVGVLAVFSYALKLANEWWEVNRFEFHKLIEVKIQKPITIEQRKPIEVVSPIVKIAEEPVQFNDMDEVEKIILEVFGIENYKVARAIAIHENAYIARGNKWDSEAWNANTNGSIDVGIFQINSVHFKKEGCGFKELLDVRANVLCAKQIYDVQGWEPWVVYQTGSFKRSL